MTRDWGSTTTAVTGSEGLVYCASINIASPLDVPRSTEAGWWRWLGNGVEQWHLNLSLSEIIVRHKGIPHEVRMAMLDRLIPHLHEENIFPPTDDARAMLAYLLAEETESGL